MRYYTVQLTEIFNQDEKIITRLSLKDGNSGSCIRKQITSSC